MPWLHWGKLIYGCKMSKTTNFLAAIQVASKVYENSEVMGMSL